MVWLTNAALKRAWNESKELTFAPKTVATHDEAFMAESQAQAQAQAQAQSQSQSTLIHKRKQQLNYIQPINSK